MSKLSNAHQDQASATQSMSRVYFSYLLKHNQLALLGILCSLITALSGVALLAVSGWFISAAALAGLSVAAAHGFNYFTPAAAVRGLSISRTAGRYAERLLNHEVTFRVIAQLRSDFFKRIAERGTQGGEHLDSHDASSKLLEDIERTEKLHLGALIPLAMSAAVAVLYLALLFIFLGPLSVVFLPSLLISVVFLPWLYWRVLSTNEDDLNQQSAQLWKRSSAAFSSLRTLILFQRLPHVREELLNGFDHSADDEKKTALKQAKLQSLVNLNGEVWLVLALGVALFGFAQGHISGALVFMLILLTLGVQEALFAAVPAWSALGQGLAALSRVNALVDKPTSKDTRVFSNGAPSISFNNLSFGYQSQPKPLFTSLNLKLAHSHWVWLKGRSGAGKTTLFDLIDGSLQASSGALEMTVNTHVLRVHQRVDIFKATLADNLKLHRHIDDDKLYWALEQVELNDWASMLDKGLDTWLGEGGVMPSGGERKRIALARALLSDADIILLDEPAAGLDHELAQRVMQRMKVQWNHRLVVVITHDNYLISENDTVYSLSDGELLRSNYGS